MAKPRHVLHLRGLRCPKEAASGVWGRRDQRGDLDEGFRGDPALYASIDAGVLEGPDFAEGKGRRRSWGFGFGFRFGFRFGLGAGEVEKLVLLAVGFAGEAGEMAAPVGAVASTALVVGEVGEAAPLRHL